ncbi:hypothetical protein Fmac_022779 [Flemingia macrophylla]|uniref:C2H2-type domain-containing protein n=1 Tax=Flemingia macrophylla TaxID=520843 RepID=A0ABD1M0M9_9FABA
MEKNNIKVCKICDKCFSNGKALGGHMRSHFAKLPIPPKPETNNQVLDNSAELNPHPIQSASSLISLPQKKPAHDFRSLKRSPFSFLETSNRENESRPYPKNPTRKRSKCHRKFIAAVEVKAEPEQASSKQDSLSAEEAARSLLMLSKDTWPERKEIKKEEMTEINIMEAKDRVDGRDDLLVQTESRAKFKCDRCGKIFQCHQALGGHKANHKKNKNTREGGDFDDGASGKNTDAVDQKAFECTYCSRVFKSARALGGHKKVHSSGTKLANAQTTANQFGGKLVVDLNFPAPIEDKEVIYIED